MNLDFYINMHILQYASVIFVLILWSVEKYYTNSNFHRTPSTIISSMGGVCWVHWTVMIQWYLTN